MLISIKETIELNRPTISMPVWKLRDAAYRYKVLRRKTNSISNIYQQYCGPVGQ